MHIHEFRLNLSFEHFELSVIMFSELVVNFLNTPTLIIAGSHDTLCPIDLIKNMMERHEKHSGKRQIFIKEFLLEHFDFITQHHFSKLVDSTVQFLKKNL